MPSSLLRPVTHCLAALAGVSCVAFLGVRDVALAQNGVTAFVPPRLVRLRPSEIGGRASAASSAAQNKCRADWDIARLQAASEGAWNAARAARGTDQSLEAWETSPPYREAVRTGEILAEARVAMDQCVEIAFVPVVWQFPLHTSPSTSSPILGHLEGRSDHRNLASFRYLPVDAGAVDVELDDVDYEEAVLHTALAERDGWVLLPRRPWPTPVWVHVAEQDGPTDVGIFTFHRPVEARSVSDGRAVALDADRERGYMLVAVEGGEVRIREEVDSDMMCEEEVPTAETRARELRDAKQFLLPPSSVQDEDGHLLLKTKYTKGC